jgi:hypothetical protein
MAKNAAMDDLFGHVPQNGELPITKPMAQPAYDPNALRPDHVDPDLPPVPRNHTKETIRARMLAILNKAKAAKTMPFTPEQIQSHTGLYPYMAEWLSADGEGARLQAEFDAEMVRLKITK